MCKKPVGEGAKRVTICDMGNSWSQERRPLADVRGADKEPFARASGQGMEWTMTGPAVALVGLAASAPRCFSIHASARRLDSCACSTVLKMLIEVTVSSPA